MRNTLLTTAAILGLAIGPVLALTPPAPNASVGSPQPAGSVPPGAGTGVRTGAGDAVGGASTQPGMTGIRPLRGQQRQYGTGTPARTTKAPRATMAAGERVDAPRTGEYRGGAGSPLSTAASNTTAANTRSEIAPRLPDPAAASNTPQAYLAAAQRALSAGRTGAAQEALERAETRLLSRSTVPSDAGTPDASPMIAQIGTARRALASRDTAGARTAINAALAGS